MVGRISGVRSTEKSVGEKSAAGRDLQNFRKAEKCRTFRKKMPYRIAETGENVGKVGYIAGNGV